MEKIKQGQKMKGMMWDSQEEPPLSGEALRDNFWKSNMEVSVAEQERG